MKFYGSILKVFENCSYNTNEKRMASQTVIYSIHMCVIYLFDDKPLLCVYRLK